MHSGGNFLLAALAPEDMRRLRDHFEPVQLSPRQVLFETGSRPQHVYFPTGGVLSLVHAMSDGASAAIAMVGNEGAAGCALVGGEPLPWGAVVQCEGHALRVKAGTIEREFRRAGRLQLLMLRYTHALITQMAQVAVCNRHHSAEQRLCRWLLTSVDRLMRPDLAVTQELIANILGVRREGVTEAVRRLQGAGAIRYSRGRIALLSRSKAEARACECYGFLLKETNRLLTRVYRARNPLDPDL